MKEGGKAEGREEGGGTNGGEDREGSNIHTWQRNGGSERKEIEGDGRSNQGRVESRGRREKEKEREYRVGDKTGKGGHIISEKGIEEAKERGRGNRRRGK